MARKVVRLDCSVGEGGGGALRLALPLAVLRKIDLNLVNLRSGRSLETRGVGWTHSAFIDAVCRWTGSSADYVLGGTEVNFYPGEDARGLLRIDLDDPDRTFATDSVQVHRKYAEASDHFITNIDNFKGRGVRGHAASMYLLGLLPLLAVGDAQKFIEISGGTETPGAPFVDVIVEILFPQASSIFSLDVGAHVLARGLMGRGGGYVQASRGGQILDVPHEGVDSSVRVYIFGDSSYRAISEESARINMELINNVLGVNITFNMVSTPYGRNQTQILFLLSNGEIISRDVSVCAEEGLLWNVAAIAERVAAELQFSGLMSRFISEQLLPVAGALGVPYEFVTEKYTAHLDSVVTLIKHILHVDIQVTHFGDGSASVRLSGE